MRPAIRLEPAVSDDEAVAIGSSKLGGSPDLPAGMAWPRAQGVALAFVAQLDLSELTNLEVASLLPASGLLSFFFEATWAIAGSSPRWGWDVVYVPPGASLHRVAPPADLDEYGHYGTASVSPRPVPTFVGWESPEFEALEMTPEERSMYWAAMAALEEEERARRAGWSDDDVRWLTFQLLGHPQDVNGNLQLECQYVANGLSMRDPRYDDRLHQQFAAEARHWRLLFQADSWDAIGMDWFGFGRLYYCIREDDLVDRRFHRTVAASHR